MRDFEAREPPPCNHADGLGDNKSQSNIHLERKVSAVITCGSFAASRVYGHTYTRHYAITRATPCDMVEAKVHRPDDAQSPTMRGMEEASSEDLSATIIQARWRGESSRRDDDAKKKGCRVSLPSLTVGVSALAAPVKAALAPAKAAAQLVGMQMQLVANPLHDSMAKAAAISEELRTDMGQAKQALENHLEFPFLASETHPMHGLQDWSAAEWAMQMQKTPELSALLAQSLLNIGDGNARYDPCELALQVCRWAKRSVPACRLVASVRSPSGARMGLARGSRSHAWRTLPHLALQVKEALREAQPLSKWRTVIAYQNACLNASHELDDESEAFYMSPGLLSNAVFRRDFPLGVDKRVAQYRWRFAIENSGTNPSPSPSPRPRTPALTLTLSMALTLP